MAYVSRQKQYETLIPEAPAFRWQQIERALFNPTIHDWTQITTLSKDDRTKLATIPWLSLAEVKVLVSNRKDTIKAVVKLTDDAVIETVLMRNRRDDWTLCASSQVGCAMGCVFCATGKMGLSRSLAADEIIDQYRFWQHWLAEHPEHTGRISNIVMMGMGEPLVNYENLKIALRTWLAQTDIGPTHITVSTVGVLPSLEKILIDPDWPPVKIAVSLHSAIQTNRKQIVPTTSPNFIQDLGDWARRYLKILGNRRHHLTFEYIMLKGINDQPEHAKALVKLSQAIGRVKINLIPYNPINEADFQRTADETIVNFINTLQDAGLVATSRKTMGDDIAAACGQLIVARNPALRAKI